MFSELLQFKVFEPSTRFLCRIVAVLICFLLRMQGYLVYSKVMLDAMQSAALLSHQNISQQNFASCLAAALLSFSLLWSLFCLQAWCYVSLSVGRARLFVSSSCGNRGAIEFIICARECLHWCCSSNCPKELWRAFQCLEVPAISAVQAVRIGGRQLAMCAQRWRASTGQREQLLHFRRSSRCQQCEREAASRLGPRARLLDARRWRCSHRMCFPLYLLCRTTG